MSTEKLPCVEINPSQSPVASVIWLHGLGADGNDFAGIIPELKLPASLPVRFVFPHAPVRPVSINNGYPMRAWYDIFAISPQAAEDEPGIMLSAEAIKQLIAHEMSLGVPAHRIVLAGFSQGGAMALYAGLRYEQRLAGILALSTYLPLAKMLPAEASAASRQIPIFMAHGNLDAVVPLLMGEASRNFLQQCGHTVDFRVYPMQHSVCVEEIADIGAWLKNLLAAN